MSDIITKHRLLTLLKDERRFCCTGVPTSPKAPADTAGKLMQWSDDSLWLPLTAALAPVLAKRMPGIGLFTSNGDRPDLTPLTVIDLDHCVQGERVVSEWQADVMAIANTFTPISPSGTGLHLYFTGVAGFTAPEISSVKGQATRGFECYSKAHHVRVGMAVMNDVDPRPMTPELWNDIASCLPGWLDEHAELARKPEPIETAEPTKTPTTAPGKLSDRQVAFVAGKFNDNNTIATVLTERGYTVDVKGNVTRPGKKPSDGYSGNIKGNIYFTFSANDPLPTNGKGAHGYTAFGAWCRLDYVGDEQLAARAAADKLGIELMQPTDHTGKIENAELVRKELAKFSPDGAGNTDAFISIHGKIYLFSTALGWLKWTGKHWQRGDADAALEIDVRDILRERQAAGALTQNNAVVSASSPTMTHVSEVVSFLTSILRVSADKFDAHAHLLNVRNGVVNLKTGKLMEHDPHSLLTHLVDVDYDTGADVSL